MKKTITIIFLTMIMSLSYGQESDPPVSFTSVNFPTTGQYKRAVVDMNGDYLDDIVAVSANYVEIHYQNPDGTFTAQTITTDYAENVPSWSLAAADFNGDGFTDLLYGGGSGVTFMIANSDGTAFIKQTFSQYVFSQRSNFVDINNDGHLDAFVCHDVAPNVYYLNDGDGNLQYNQGGLGDYPSGGNYGSIWVDYDNDGDMDLFIAKCRGGGNPASINELHRNNGDGTFTDVSEASGLQDPIQTWSSAWGDFDNDGFMDVMVGASSLANGSHKLMKNNGDGTFTNITSGSGIETFTGLGIEYVAHDFDNDGYIDIFCGDSAMILFNNGDFTFTPVQVNAVSGAIGDLNNDGFLDVFSNTTIRINSGNDNNWIKFNLQGVQSNRNGIGARIEIYGSWGKQIRDVRSGEGFRFMNTLNAHFGIGQATEITQVIIRWPSGIVDTINNPDINQSLFVLEGQTLSVEEQVVSDFKMYPNPVRDILTIQSNSSIFEQARIYDLSGKLVLEGVLTNNSIFAGDLLKGTYILLLTDRNGQQVTQKFIKK